MNSHEAYEGEVNYKNAKVGCFSKVTLGQWMETMANLVPNMKMRTLNRLYEQIKLPQRATICSAGYDICSPISFDLAPGETIKIPTGLRCSMVNKFFLAILPRSSVGMKNGVSLVNTMGVIDADYYFAENEGHIILMLKNNLKKSWRSKKNRERTWHVKAGDRVCQGIFLPYGITYDDQARIERSGGIGSTGK